MLKNSPHLWWLRVVLPIVGGLMLMIYAATFSASYQVCKAERAQTYAAQHQNNLLHEVAGVVVCEGVTLDVNGVLLTALATIIMAGFTGTLWWTSAEQGRLTKKSIGIAETQAAIAAAQTDILAKQKEISRLQYFAEYRPRLILRDVFFSSPNDWDSLTYELSNIGGSQAKIVGGFIEISFITDERQFKDTAGRDLGGANGAVLGAGELRQFDKDVPAEIRDYCALEEGFYGRYPDARRIVVVGEKPAPSGTLYFFGAVTYVDGRGEEFGITRLSVFRREWKSNRFERTENPDHEYAD